VERRRRREAELQQHQWGDQRADEHVPPGDQETDGFMQALGRVGRERTGGRHVLGQFRDADRAEQAGDECEHHRQRQRTTGKRGTGWDRGGYGGARRHVGHALKQHFPEADRIAAQRRRGGNDLMHHGDLASEGVIMRSFRRRYRERNK